MRSFLKAGLALAAILPLAACSQDSPKKPCIAVVDVVKVMQESTPAKAGAEHIQQVRAVLQQNMQEIEDALKDQPEQQRASSLLQGQQFLQEQLNRESAEVNGIVSGLLTDCVKEWHQSQAGSDVAAVISRQSLLDSQASIDVTDPILVCMNKREAKFGPLPNFTVKKADPKTAKSAPAKSAASSSEGKTETKGKDESKDKKDKKDKK